MDKLRAARTVFINSADFKKEYANFFMFRKASDFLNHHTKIESQPALKF